MKIQETSVQGAWDAAAVLPLLLMILLIPPIVTIFAVPVTIGRVPLILVYLFSVWGGAIVASFLLARRLARIERAHLDRPLDRNLSGTDADR